VEQIYTWILKGCEGVQGGEGIDDYDVEVVLLNTLLDVFRKNAQPVLGQLLLRVLVSYPADIQHVDVKLVDVGHAEVHHRPLQALIVLLQRDVKALQTVPFGILVHYRIRDRRLHRPGSAAYEDNVTSGNASVQNLVKTIDISGNLLHHLTVDDNVWKVYICWSKN